MVYLDYSATTPVDKRVLDTFSKVCMDFPGNPNSLHKLGVEAKKLCDEATDQIANLLGVKKEEIIYTSGSSESNNLAIKGIALKYQNRGKHIITTNLEHSSIYGPISYLQHLGFEIDFVKTDRYGLVDMDDLKSLIRDDTILVSICSVSSETGICQDIEKIGELLKNYNCFFHCDMTQSIGKKNISLKNIDLVSFSSHKFYGLKGIGVLIKKEKIDLVPLIHGGKSTTIYRSGTPALPLIVSLSKALRLALNEMNNDYVMKLNSIIRERISYYENVSINSNKFCIPQILNISVIGIKPETMQHSFEEDEIYISTQSACSSSNPISRSVLEVTKDKNKASYSIRISISTKTTEKEIELFLKSFDRCYKKLMIRGEKYGSN